MLISINRTMMNLKKQLEKTFYQNFRIKMLSLKPLQEVFTFIATLISSMQFRTE
ncbi:hypothetical protein TVAGG3_0378820 [Trichomonas vaginalis G3]|uniref:hypothetical protein n=1 Tax=Trichomonas vaginalis (strain ATCC PRA-98 / G3) TaxID=412133 RepID=UPI0021E56D4F|nr:hypothetical protein TVAGG3_0378820 [Trichomonas vaginalis G3]KAI5533121.1 hypothetical protein TVAGG3_0378820 [Trichomonas vaginalis G3]